MSKVSFSKQFQLQIAQKTEQLAARGLKSYPQVHEKEVQAAEAIGPLLELLEAPLIIRHPTVDLKMQLGPEIGGRIVHLLTVGDYEQGDLILLSKYLKKGDSYLDLGGGLGLCAALAGKITGKPVTVVEADARLNPYISAQLRLNNASGNIINGCVVKSGFKSKKIKFQIHKEFWYSSSSEVSKVADAKSVYVDAVHLNDLLKKHKPSALMVDIEGAEQGLFKSVDGPLPEKLFIEIHFPVFGEVAGCQVINEILDLGYKLHEFNGWTFYFQRG